MMRLLRCCAVLLPLLALGCTSPCVELAKKICACRPTEYERDVCEQTATDEESRTELTEADEQRCESLLDGCDCGKLDTAEGKRACGLAR